MNKFISRQPLWLRIVLGLLLAWLLVVLLLMAWWDHEPAYIDVDAAARDAARARDAPLVTGAVTSTALIESVHRLLDKRGGYLSNDKLPPGAWMDNVPNWEFGVLTASRDLARELRNRMSRSQSQSEEDPDLREADPLLSSPNDRWLLPSSEGQYRKALRHLKGYRSRLGEPDKGSSFHARADNLADYMDLVSSRLGSLSQRLSAAAGQLRLEGDAPVLDELEPEPAALFGRGSGPQVVRTPWTKIDDNFYEARGYTWALLEQLKAFEVDFGPVLERKGAVISLKQIIRELEEAQKPVRSPVILNGRPFGFFGNHSLVMANYISRANAAVIDLRELLTRG